MPCCRGKQAAFESLNTVVLTEPPDPPPAWQCDCNSKRLDLVNRSPVCISTSQSDVALHFDSKFMYCG